MSIQLESNLPVELWSFKIPLLVDSPCACLSHYYPWYFFVSLYRKAAIFFSIHTCSICNRDYSILFPRLIELNGVETPTINTLKPLWSLDVSQGKARYSFTKWSSCAYMYMTAARNIIVTSALNRMRSDTRMLILLHCLILCHPRKFDLLIYR